MSEGFEWDEDKRQANIAERALIFGWPLKSFKIRS
jgi:uncharacterized DUF497 family protein